MNWFYEYNGEQKGPVTEAELDGLIAQGIVLPTTLVWRDGLPNWTPLAQVRTVATGPSGGAAPGTTQCEVCGRFFDSADVVQIGGRNTCAGCKPGALQLLQSGGVMTGPNDPARNGPAWEHRETLGWFVSGWRTVVAVLTRPSETFATMRVEGGLTSPFLFYTLLSAIITVVRLVYASLFTLIGIPMGTFGKSNDVFLLGGGTVMLLILQFVAAFIFTIILSFIFGAVFHVSLMLFGGARRPFEATYRAICYGAGAVSVLNVIPILGAFIYLVWILVAWIIGLARTHETDLWRAVLAVIVPIAICCIAVFGVIVAFAGAMVQSIK